MSRTFSELAERRARLVARSDAQRAQLSYYYRQFDGPVRATQRVLGLMNSLRRSPLVITVLAAALMKTPWRKVARAPKLAWRGWQIFQWLRRWVI